MCTIKEYSQKYPHAIRFPWIFQLQTSSSLSVQNFTSRNFFGVGFSRFTSFSHQKTFFSKMSTSLHFKMFFFWKMSVFLGSYQTPLLDHPLIKKWTSLVVIFVQIRIVKTNKSKYPSTYILSDPSLPKAYNQINHMLWIFTKPSDEESGELYGT